MPHAAALLVSGLFAWLSACGAVPVAGFIFASAAIEHVFPPFPGDLAVAFGAALAFARGWFVPWFFLAAVAGSALGSVATFYAGRLLAAPRAAPDGPRAARLRAAVEPAVAAVMKRGAAAVVLSRFVPVGRAVCIVAAGYGGMPAARAIPAAVAGAALWLGVLFAVGGAVGTNLERIKRVLGAYGNVAWALLAVGALVWAVRAWRRKRATRTA